MMGTDDVGLEKKHTTEIVTARSQQKHEVRFMNGDEWRAAFDADGARREVSGESGFDELVIGSWFHIERMDHFHWWIRIGPSRVSIFLKPNGDVDEIMIEPRCYEDPNESDL